MRDPRPETSGVDPMSSSVEMNDNAWDAQQNSAGHRQLQQQHHHHQGGPVAPQRARDDAAVGYFYQRPGSDIADGSGQPGNKQRWAVGDEGVIDQVRSGDMGKMNNMFQALQMDNSGREFDVSAKRLWDSEEGKNDMFLNQWPGPGGPTWGVPTSDHAVSQPIMVQRRLSPATFQGQENAVLSPRSDTGGLGLSMAEYVLATSPQGKADMEGKLNHRLKPGFPGPGPAGDADPTGKNGTKKSKTPSPFEGEGEDKKGVENNGLPHKEEDGPYIRNPGSRNSSPTENEDPRLQQSHQNPNMVPEQSHHHHQQQQQQQQQHHPNRAMYQQHSRQQAAAHHGLTQQEVTYIEQQQQQQQQQQAVASQLEIDTGQMDSGSNMGDQLQFDYAAQQMVPSMDSPSYVDYSQGQPGSVQMFQQRQATPQAITVQQLTPQQQQQYAIAAAAQQQQLAGLAQTAFAPNPYIIAGGPNGQDPYSIAIPGGAAVVQPQYAYGVAPWSVYPVGIIQQQQQQGQQQQQQQQQQQGQQQQQVRGQNGRPMTPQQQQQQQQQQAQGDQAGNQATSNQAAAIAQAQAAQALQAGYQVLAPAYYDQTGALIINPRPGTVGAPMRLVSPAPVIVSSPQQASVMNGLPANGFRLMGSQQGGQQQGPAALSMYGSNAMASNAPQNNAGNLGSYTPTSSVFSNGSIGAVGSSVGPIGTSLGSSGPDSPTARRDSLTGSDYKRQGLSMSQFYGSSPQLGPIGMPSAAGSLTPPPSQSGLGGLGLDNLLTAPSSWDRTLQKRDWGAGRAVNPAAPFGSEVKFRSGATASSTGWSNTLFPPRSLRSSAYMEKSAPGRSRLLEDFRNNRFPNLQLRDLSGHIVEFSQDQHGSRFIQQKLERATSSERQMVFSEILGAAYSLMTDVFGNYVIQKFFEFGTTDQKQALAQRIRGHVLPLALQMYGCRVIQKALESIPPELQLEVVQELDGHVLKCVKDQNGNHVVQKCIECVDPVGLQFIVEAFRSQVYSLSTHPYGCRVIQRILEHCTVDQTKPLLDELHEHTEPLVQDQYGNYVIQHVLEHGRPEDKSKIVSELRGKVLLLSQHKFASNVVEKCVTHSSRPERALLIDEVCSYNDGNNSALYTMMKDQYANYVVQKMIDVAEPNQRKILMHKIRPHVGTLRKFTYGKHILAKLEKFFMKSSNDLGPIGGPPNGSLSV